MRQCRTNFGRVIRTPITFNISVARILNQTFNVVENDEAESSNRRQPSIT
jgi:hypothetical protein